MQVAAGKIGAPPFDGHLQTEYTLQTKGRLEDVEEFENIVLRARGRWLRNLPARCGAGGVGSVQITTSSGR